MKLAGRVALVTGASRGVGQAVACELARRGANLVLAARSVDEAAAGIPGTLQDTARQVREQGAEALTVGADLNDPDSVSALAQAAVAWKGRVDVLVNNAAFMGRAAYHSLDELDLRNFQRQFNVNVTAGFILAKAVVPGMRERGEGVVVNVTSGAGLIGVYDTPGIAYGSTKAAVNRLSTLLARDLGVDGIAVFAVDPGYTRTYLVEQTAAQVGLDAANAHPPEVPASVIADLIEADIAVSTGRVWKTVAGEGPRLVADSSTPMPEGIEVQL